jgi:hypothetical protein
MFVACLGCSSGPAGGDGSTSACTPGCAAGQVCAAGYCVPRPADTPCGTNPFDPDDGCGPDAICLPNVIVDGVLVGDRRCYAFGPCPAEGCPIGTQGAACNVETGAETWWPDKNAICIATLCRAATDCPSGQRCIPDSRMRLSYCSDGSAGAVCRDAADCTSGTCMALGGLGNCL